ncbi:MAG: hypothetical protein ACOX0A_06055 [Thermoguttaceae bacterium]|jgi:hypothetical protein
MTSQTTNAPFLRRSLALATILTILAASTCAVTSAFAQGVHSPYSAMSGETLGVEYGEDSERYFGPSDFVLDAEGEYFYVVGLDSRALVRLRVDGSAPGERIALEFKPVKLAFLHGETALAIVGGDDQGKLAIVEIADKTEDGRKIKPMRVADVVAAGHSPTDVVTRATENASFIYVCNCFAGLITEFDAETLEVTRTWEAGREPFAMEITPQQDKLVIANRITDMVANHNFTHANVRIIELESGELSVVELYNEHNLLHDVAISADGRYAFISAVQCSFTSITSQVSGGWISENCVLCVDTEAKKLVEIYFLDDPALGSGNPWGVAISDDEERLIVSIAGTDEIIYLPLKRLIQKINDRPEWARPGYGAYSYSSFTDGEVQLPFRLRVKFGFKGLRQIVTRGDDVYVLAAYDDVICKATLKLDPPYSYFPNSYVRLEKPPVTQEAAREAGVLDQEANGAPIVVEEPLVDREDEASAALFQSVADNEALTAPLKFVPLTTSEPLRGVQIERAFARLAPKPLLTMRRRGEILFHDATACFEHWLSCVTCHPDARADGFNWDLLNDGTGNLKNTKSMLLTHETPPSMITGIRADGEEAVRAGFVHILFTTYKEDNARCVDEYLKALKPMPSPYLVDGELSESAQRGKEIFNREEVGCARCHPESNYFTDQKLHRVGSQDPNDFFDAFDTPTLIEVWRTAPYLNTGAYTTIRELLEEGKHGVRKGEFDALSKQEQDDLIEYVLSL